MKMAILLRGSFRGRPALSPQDGNSSPAPSARTAAKSTGRTARSGQDAIPAAEAAEHRLNLTGTWYAQGDRSKSCSIRQRGNNLQLSNESGDNASGQMNGKRTLTTNWNGTTIGGTVSANGNRINWDNGTYWTRFRVYGSQNN